MKKLVIFSTLFIVLLSVNPVSAQTKGPKRDLKVIKDNKIEKFQEDLRQKLRLNVGAKIVDGEITAVSDSSLTVLKDGTSYTVQIDSRTHFRRHFWGKSELDEFSVGNHVNVYGKFTDDSKTTILARLIRNLSIQKRNGVFFGEVISKADDSLVMKTRNRGDQTVFFSDSTNFKNRKEETIGQANIQVGHRVRVKGLWDKTLSTITEVSHLKDFSLPPRPTKAPSPTPTP